VQIVILGAQILGKAFVEAGKQAARSEYSAHYSEMRSWDSISGAIYIYHVLMIEPGVELEETSSTHVWFIASSPFPRAWPGPCVTNSDPDRTHAQSLRRCKAPAGRRRRGRSSRNRERNKRFSHRPTDTGPPNDGGRGAVDIERKARCTPGGDCQGTYMWLCRLGMSGVYVFGWVMCMCGCGLRGWARP
jgi:hypothetical protein